MIHGGVHLYDECAAMWQDAVGVLWPGLNDCGALRVRFCITNWTACRRSLAGRPEHT
jgi:hypothetical protein